MQKGGGRCSLCGSPGTNVTTCPLNPRSTRPNHNKHPLAVAPVARGNRTSPTEIEVIDRARRVENQAERFDKQRLASWKEPLNLVHSFKSALPNIQNVPNEWFEDKTVPMDEVEYVNRMLLFEQISKSNDDLQPPLVDLITRLHKWLFFTSEWPLVYNTPMYTKYIRPLRTLSTDWFYAVKPPEFKERLIGLRSVFNADGSGDGDAFWECLTVDSASLNRQVNVRELDRLRGAEQESYIYHSDALATAPPPGVFGANVRVKIRAPATVFPIIIFRVIETEFVVVDAHYSVKLTPNKDLQMVLTTITSPDEGETVIDHEY
jgi:hypothetical protein